MVSGITDGSGNAQFTNVSPGSHNVTATKDALSASRSINVTQDETFTLTLTPGGERLGFGWLAIGGAGALILTLVGLAKLEGRSRKGRSVNP